MPKDGIRHVFFKQKKGAAGAWLRGPIAGPTNTGGWMPTGTMGRSSGFFLIFMIAF